MNREQSTWAFVMQHSGNDLDADLQRVQIASVQMLMTSLHPVSGRCE